MAATGIMTATQAEPRSAPDVRRRRFTRADYYAMGRAGILDHRKRLELIDGAVDRLLPGRAGGDDARRTAP